MQIGEIYKLKNNRFKSASVQIISVDNENKELSFVFLEPSPGKIITTMSQFEIDYETDPFYESR
jgi:hypothetical protein